MKSYDLMVVPALKLERDWQLPEDLKVRLDYAAKAYKAGRTNRLLMSGSWSIWFEWLGITPPITEATVMKKYLLEKGVSSSAILIEEKSHDTIGNIYHLQSILTRFRCQNIAILGASSHIPRLQFLCSQLLNQKVNIDYISFDAPHFAKDTTGNEQRMLKEQAAVVCAISKLSPALTLCMIYTSIRIIRSKQFKSKNCLITEDFKASLLTTCRPLRQTC